jgi:hypothetical protein
MIFILLRYFLKKNLKNKIYLENMGDTGNKIAEFYISCNGETDCHDNMITEDCSEKNIKVRKQNGNKTAATNNCNSLSDDNIVTSVSLNENIKVRKQKRNNCGIIYNSGFHCSTCNHNFTRKNDYDRHVVSKKHIERKYNNNDTKQSTQNDNCCNKCNRKYKTRAGLWKHSKLCVVEEKKMKMDDMMEIISMMMESQEKKTTNTMKEVFIDLLKQNTDDFKELMKESYQAVTINQTNMNNCNNNNNNKFNLNFFLNDTCKDAMNIMDFVEMVKSELKLKDFEAYENGYSNTVSGLFLRGLKGLEVNQRPIHCSDLKREVLYVKDDNVWHLDSNELLVTKAIKYISHYNFKQYPAWQKAHPACEDTNSKVHEHYMKLVRNCMSGGTDEEIENNYKKIIRNVMKEVVIDKKKTKNICE